MNPHRHPTSSLSESKRDASAKTSLFPILVSLLVVIIPACTKFLTGDHLTVIPSTGCSGTVKLRDVFDLNTGIDTGSDIVMNCCLGVDNYGPHSITLGSGTLRIHMKRGCTLSLTPTDSGDDYYLDPPSYICDMIQYDPQPPTEKPAFTIHSREWYKFHEENGVFSCEVAGKSNSMAFLSTYHFGCESVQGASVSSPHMWQFDSSTEPDFEDNYLLFEMADGTFNEDTVDARDFRVNYADWISGKPLDEASCKAFRGQAGWILADDTAMYAFAAWINNQVQPFYTGQFTKYESQGVSTSDANAVYVSPEEYPCATTSFPIDVPGLARCSMLTPDPMPPTESPLYLYWWESHMADETESFQLEMQLETSGSTQGLRIESNPPVGEPFTVRGGEERQGSIRICNQRIRNSCTAPDIPEGRQLEITAIFRDPSNGAMQFTQHMKFLEDRTPPEIAGPIRWSRNGNRLEIDVLASDQHSSPVASHIQYKLRGTDEWKVETLDPDVEPHVELDRLRRSFGGELDLPVPTSLEYVLFVQDNVFNVLYTSGEFREVGSIVPQGYFPITERH